MGLSHHSFYSVSHTPNLSFQSAPDYGVLHNVQVTPPRNAYNSISIVESERQLTDQLSPCWDSEKALGSSSISSAPSNDTSTTKSCAELVEEIYGLEVEIVHLERHLLSLYRSAFAKHAPTLSDSPKPLQYKSELLMQYKACNTFYTLEGDMQRSSTTLDDRVFCSRFWASSDSLSYAYAATPKEDQKSMDSGHRSLADHLGGSYIHDILTTPDRLSENIARCMSSIYCKISDSSHTKVLKKDIGPYNAMIEVMKVHLDDDSFKYASTMLQKVRLMVQSLEKMDPRKMKREGKLSFWINIHNALVMHAYLAYGTHDRVKDTSIFKAAYNIGGHCVNAYTIQSSILGIRPHITAPWLHSILPSKKFNTGGMKHTYAIEYPEPLVHFALSSGAHSDPAVRVYTADNIFQDLKLAKDEFLQASICIHKESKVFLPKVLYYFAKDMSLGVPGVMKVVDESISRDQRKAIKRCIMGRPEKFIHWLSHSSTFRFLIHEELTKGRYL